MTEQPVDAPELATLKLLNYGAEPDLVSAAISHARSRMPEWQPRGGNTEVVLMEALAVMLGPEILAIQLVGPQMTEQLMRFYGVTRSPGLAARGRVEFAVTASSATQVIPAGTRLRLSIDESVDSIDLFTTENLSVTTAQTLIGQVDVVAEQFGASANGAPSGAKVAVVDNLPFVESARLVEALAGGADEESDASFNARTASTFARQNTTIQNPRQFEYAALSRLGVGRARTIDNFDPAAPNATTYGHVTIALAGIDGEPLTADEMEATRVDLATQALASLSVHVIEATYTTVAVDVTVKRYLNRTVAEVEQAVRAALAEWIDPATWGWKAAATQFEIVAVVSQVDGVAEVVSATDGFDLAGAAPLPRLGAVTVTVVS